MNQLISIQRVNLEPLILNKSNIITLKITNNTKDNIENLKIILDSEVIQDNQIKNIDNLSADLPLLLQFKIIPIVKTSLGIINIIIESSAGRVSANIEVYITDDSKKVFNIEGSYFSEKVDEYKDDRVTVEKGGQYIGDESIIQRSSIEPSVITENIEDKKMYDPREKLVYTGETCPDKTEEIKPAAGDSDRAGIETSKPGSAKLSEKTLIIIESDMTEKYVLLNKSIIRAGRSKTCPYSGEKMDIVLRAGSEQESLKISRNHFIIKYENNNFVLYDSSNLFKKENSRTSCNGSPVKKIVLIENMELKAAGAAVINIEISDENVILKTGKITYLIFKNTAYFKFKGDKIKYCSSADTDITIEIEDNTPVIKNISEEPVFYNSVKISPGEKQKVQGNGYRVQLERRT